MNLGTGSLAAMGIGAIVAVIFIILWAVITIVAQWKFFEKCGEKGWKAIIPYYNDWTLVEISECHWWFLLLILGNSIITLFVEETEIFGVLALFSGILSLVSIYTILCVNYNIAKKFNQGIGFALGLTLVPFVFYFLIAFSNKYQFNKNIKVSPWGIYDFETKTNLINTKKSFCTNCGSEMSAKFCPKCGKNKKGE